MNDARNHDVQLDQLLNDSTGRLVCNESFNEESFEILYNYLSTKSESIKEDFVVSKQVLKSLLQTIGSLNGLISKSSNLQSAEIMYNKFAELLRLISIGEAPSDRQSGVPRVI